MPVIIDGTNGINTPNTFAFKNRIIDGGFTINQRGYVTNTSLTSGSYGHDRWKGGASNGTYTFTQASAGVNTTITITAGSIIQVIEGANLPEGGTYVLSWTGTAQGKIGAGSFGASGITGTITAGTNTNIEFNTGTCGNVQLEVGSTATSFDYRPFGTELQLCQRYFFKNSIDSGNGTYMIGVVSSSTAVNRCYNRFPATMRSAPTASFSGSPRLWDGSVDPTVTSISNNNSQTWGSGINIEATGGGLSTGRACLVIDGPSSSSFSFSAEL